MLDSVGASITLEEMIRDPHQANHRLRTESPVAWVPALGGWLVTERRAAIEVMRDAATYTVDDPRFTTGQVVGPSMLSLDGDEHRRHREPFANSYRTSRDALAAYIERESRRLVAEVAAGECADLRTALAQPLAVNVMTESLGVDATPAEVRSIYDAIVSAVERLSAGAEVGEVEAMRDLAALVSAALDGDAPLLRAAAGQLSIVEITSNVAVVMFGGVETSEAMIANVLWHLLSHPAEMEKVLADRTLVGAAVEESLRMEPAATRVDRYATREADLRGSAIARGDLVIVSLAGANRDPSVFRDPDVYDVTRATSRLNVTFAHGPHACLASHVAREEATAAVLAVLDQLPDVRLAGDAAPPEGLVFRKPTRVPVVWG